LFYSNVAKKSFDLRPHKSYHHLLTRKEAKNNKTFCTAKKHSIIKNESFFHQYKKVTKYEWNGNTFSSKFIIFVNLASANVFGVFHHLTSSKNDCFPIIKKEQSTNVAEICFILF
jgi:hypothetical protein